MSDKKTPTDIRRQCMLVRSIDEALKIYRDILGLEVWYDEQMTLAGLKLPVGQTDTLARLVILKSNDPMIGMLAMLEYLDPRLPSRDEYPKQLGIGDIVFVLNHDDVESIYDQIKGLDDVYIQSEPHLVEYPAPDGAIYRRMQISFFDTNGYFLEVNQLLN